MNGNRIGIAIVLCSWTIGVASAQERKGPGDLVGDWRGGIQISPGVELSVVVHVTKEGEELKVVFDSPDQKALGFETKDVSLEEDVFQFTVTKIGGGFEGKLSADGMKLAGKWKQAGMELDLVLEKGPGASAPAELKGAWEGVLKANGGVELRLVLRVEPAEGDAERLVAMLDSPDQGVEGITVNKIELKGKVVSFTVGSVGGKFEGTLDAGKGSIDGTWSQGGNSLPLKLSKTEKPTEVKKERPQDPKDPLPYEVEEITFSNEAAGVTLAGTLTRPKGDGPFPAAVLVSGSGPQDRDESLLGHRPFLVLADALTRRGVAVLRYDDRGTAKSTGDFQAATTADFAKDALAAVRYLKGRAEIGGDKIGIIGHSEGGIVAPIAAVEAPDDVAYIVMMAGPGVPGDEIIFRQQALIASAAGAKESDVESMTKVTREVIRLVKAGADLPAIKERVMALTKELKEALPEADREALGGGEGSEAVDAQLGQMTTPWFKYFLTFDPRPTLAKVECPVLAVNGERDLQVDPEQNLPEVEKALTTGGNKQFKVVELPGLNHLFQPSTTGAPAEYARIETTIDPKALELIGNWVVEMTGS